jgi:RNA polymerase sigma-70 factor (ECF subfamily)
MSTLHTNQVQPTPQHAGTVQVADFEAIVLRYQGPITTFLFRITGNREQSDALALDVFVTAYKALLAGATVQDPRLSAWLYRVATTTAYRVMRRRRLSAWLPLARSCDDRGVCKGTADAALPAGGQGKEEGMGGAQTGRDCDLRRSQGDAAAARVDDRELTERVFELLPPKDAICLWLYEHAGLSCAEIADVLSISASAVKRRLLQARERFVTLYQAAGGTLPTGGAV